MCFSNICGSCNSVVSYIAKKQHMLYRTFIPKSNSAHTRACMRKRGGGGDMEKRDTIRLIWVYYDSK